jgi:4-hydroxy-2-oxoheptanedioate aldolase
VIVAQTERVAQARLMAEVAKFPPLGNRSFGSRRLIDLYGRNYWETANREQLLILQVESPEALRRAPELAAVVGVDGLMFGPDDFTLRLGKPMEASSTNPEVWAAAVETARAAREEGKRAMGFAMPTTASIEAAVRAGFQMISVGAVARCVTEGSAALRKGIQAWRG